MSDFNHKNHKDLMEAYRSIYNQLDPVVEDQIGEQLDQEIYYENVEIDENFLVDIIVEHLIEEGYTKTENQALDIIPHIGDVWLDNIIENIIIKEYFIDCVDSLVEEGYDLSEYTWDELYEEYTDHFNRELNEVAALAPALGTPAGAAAALGGLAVGALGKVKKAADYLRTSKQWGYGDPASKRWLETGSYEARRGTPSSSTQQNSTQSRRQAALDRLRARRAATPATPATPERPRVRVTATRPAGSAETQPGPSQASTPQPEPPKRPKIDPLQTVKDLFKSGKNLVKKATAEKGPVAQVLGKPARERFFGTTRAGQITRGATTAGLSALDIGGKIADPSKPSLISKVGSVGPGAVGTVLQGTGNIPGIKGTSMGTGARGTGGALRQVGREMRDQPGTKSNKPPKNTGLTTWSNP